MSFPKRKYFNSILHLCTNSAAWKQLYLKRKKEQNDIHTIKRQNNETYHLENNKKSVSAIKLNIMQW